MHYAGSSIIRPTVRRTKKETFNVNHSDHRAGCSAAGRRWVRLQPLALTDASGSQGRGIPVERGAWARRAFRTPLPA